MSAFTDRLEQLLDTLDGELNGWGTDLDAIRSLDRDEIAFLCRFARELRWYGSRFHRSLQVAASLGTVDVGGAVVLIDRIDHPALQYIEERRKRDLELAARIKRRIMRTVDDGQPIPDEILVYPKDENR